MNDFPKRLQQVGALTYAKTCFSGNTFSTELIIFHGQEYYGAFDIAIGKKALIIMGSDSGTKKPLIVLRWGAAPKDKAQAIFGDSSDEDSIYFLDTEGWYWEYDKPVPFESWGRSIGSLTAYKGEIELFRANIER